MAQPLTTGASVLPTASALNPPPPPTAITPLPVAPPAPVEDDIDRTKHPSGIIPTLQYGHILDRSLVLLLLSGTHHDGAQSQERRVDRQPRLQARSEEHCPACP